MDPELEELLDSCGKGRGLSVSSEKELTEVFVRLVALIDAEEARDLIEEVFFAACREMEA